MTTGTINWIDALEQHIRRALDEDDLAGLHAILAGRHPADVADVIDRLDDEDKLRVFRLRLVDQNVDPDRPGAKPVDIGQGTGEDCAVERRSLGGRPQRVLRIGNEDDALVLNDGRFAYALAPVEQCALGVGSDRDGFSDHWKIDGRLPTEAGEQDRPDDEKSRREEAGERHTAKVVDDAPDRRRLAVERTGVSSPASTWLIHVQWPASRKCRIA